AAAESPEGAVNEPAVATPEKREPSAAGERPAGVVTLERLAEAVGANKAEVVAANPAVASQREEPAAGAQVVVPKRSADMTVAELAAATGTTAEKLLADNAHFTS